LGSTKFSVFSFKGGMNLAASGQQGQSAVVSMVTQQAGSSGTPTALTSGSGSNVVTGEY